jgi:hypothetical protein
MQHANAEIPQKQTTVVTDTAESVCLLVATPWVECYRRNPGVVALASRNDFAFRERPDRQEIILAACHDVLAVGRPADTYQTTVIAAEDIQHPSKHQSQLQSRKFTI